MQIRTLSRLAAAAAAAVPLWAHAQVTMKPDGQWRSLFTAGASISGGNTDARTASVAADIVKLTDHDKWSFDGTGQYAKSGGVRTADHVGGTGLYSEDITPRWFGFGQVDLLHDQLAFLRLRTTLGTGLGYHVIKEDRLTWHLSTGVAYTMDRYTEPQLVDDEYRRSYDHADVLLAEESNHKFTDNTTFHQKLTVYPSLRGNDDVRTLFDAGLSVAMSKHLSLTTSFENRYDNRPAAGLKKSDTTFVTGVSLRFD